ncbi:MAG: hypothetical protein JNM44_07570 [Chitinophagaceae bacterium]|nr:hypothetical protein [Chitinophagaceae bacterium]
MKKILVLMACSGLLLNCSPKKAKETSASKDTRQSSGQTTGTKPANNNDKQESVTFSQATPAFKDLPVDKQLEAFSNFNDKRIQSGANLYEAKCGNCHELHQPGSRTSASWIQIMNPMSAKAKLNNDEYALISAYLVANAKK